MTYSHAHTSWYEWDPVIDLQNLNLISPETHASVLKIQDIQIQINLWKSLWHFTLVTDQLQISGMNAHFFKTSNGQWSSIRLSSQQSWTPRDFIHWILLQKNLSIHQVNLYFPGVTYSDLELAWTALFSAHHNQIYGHALAFNFKFEDPSHLPKSSGSFQLNITWTRANSFPVLLKIEHWATLNSWKMLGPYDRLIAHSDFNFNLQLKGAELQPLFIPFASLSTGSTSNFPILSQLSSLGGTVNLSGDLSQGTLENLQMNTNLQSLVLNHLLTIKNINIQTEYTNQKLSTANIMLSDFDLLGPNLLFSQAWPSMDVQTQFNWRLDQLDTLMPKLSIQNLNTKIHTSHFDFKTQGPTQEIQNIPVLKNNFSKQWGDIFVNLSGNLTGQNLEQVLPSYLPNHGLSPQLKDWLLNNIIKAPVVSSDFKLLGVLKDFPFEHSNNSNNSNFFIQTYITQGEIIPWDQWPVIHNIQGSFIFSNQTFSAKVQSAQSLGVAVNEASVAIANIMPHVPSELLVSLNLSAQDNLARDYLSKTPIADEVQILKILSIKNHYQIQAQLDFPLDQPEAPNHYAAQILFLNNKIGLEHWASFPYPIENLKGELDINDRLISAKNLSGLFMAEPLSAEIHSTPINHQLNHQTADVDTKILIHGVLNSGLLKNIAPAFSGLVPFDIHVDLHSEILNIEINSALKGLVSLLPSPFNKQAEDAWPLFIHIQRTNDLNPNLNPNLNPQKKSTSITRLLINSALSNQSKQSLMILTLQAAQSQGSVWQFSSAYFQLGTVAPIKTTVSSVSVTPDLKKNSEPPVLAPVLAPVLQNSFPIKLHINLPDFSLTGSLGQVLDLWHVQIDQLRTPKLSLGVNQADQRQADKPADKAPADKLQVDQQANLKNAGTLENFLNTFDLKDLQGLPNFDLNIQHWSAEIKAGKEAGQEAGQEKNSQDLGSVHLLFMQDPQGFQIKNIDWTNPDIKITGDISWLNKIFLIQGHSTGLNYGDFLNVLGMDSFLSQTEGDLDFKLTWKSLSNSEGADLINPDIRTLGGQVKFNLKNGMLSSVNPGVSRFLGLFSLDSLSQRLAFNFNDMTHKGLAFYTLSGQYDLSEGIATTQKVEFLGPALDLLLKGSINLPDQTMDQTVLVSPHLDSSVAIVAGIIGGPVVGVATWLADHVLSDTLFKDTGLLYHLYGPWDHPEFKIENDKKSEKNVPGDVPEKT